MDTGISCVENWSILLFADVFKGWKAKANFLRLFSKKKKDGFVVFVTRCIDAKPKNFQITKMSENAGKYEIFLYSHLCTPCTQKQFCAVLVLSSDSTGILTNIHWCEVLKLESLGLR